MWIKLTSLECTVPPSPGAGHVLAMPLQTPVTIVFPDSTLYHHTAE